MQSSKQQQALKDSSPTEFIETNSQMSRDQITQNLLRALKNSGFKIKNEEKYTQTRT